MKEFNERVYLFSRPKREFNDWFTSVSPAMRGPVWRQTLEWCYCCCSPLAASPQQPSVQGWTCPKNKILNVKDSCKIKLY
jgi:hypothetical protein